jgi:4-amino-4-deoxy-L-arabinose transferase-like glycosyltransferase
LPYWPISTAALLTFYFVAGIFGRFPWKADEPYSFGIVWQMLEHHSWLIPHVADQPFVEKPPLVYWIGAASVKLLPTLPPHESARLAVLLLMGVSVLGLYLAAQWLHPEVVRIQASGLRNELTGPACLDNCLSPRRYALLAVLLMAGTLGFAEHIHKLTADVGQLSGAILGLCGLVKITANSDCDRDAGAASGSPAIGGLLLGTGMGIAFMSKGLLVPGILIVTCLLCLFIPTCRNRMNAVAITAISASTLPWLLIWPLLLYQASPQLFDEWLWTHNFGRFVGRALLGGNNVSLANRWVSTMVMGFPSLLLCVAVIARSWSLSRRVEPAGNWKLLRIAPGHACVAIYLATSLIVLAVSASWRDIYVLPALPSMVLFGIPALVLATPASPMPVRLMVNLGFGAAALLIGLVWLELIVNGDLWSEPWLRGLISGSLPLPFVLSVNWSAVIATATTLIVWSYVLHHDPLHSVTIAWCAGTATLWVVGSMLLLPWIDAARSYRVVFSEAVTHIATSNGCVATLNLGESELALFEYVTGAKIARSYLGHSGTGDKQRPNRAATYCDSLLVLSKRESGPLIPDPAHWTQIWSGARPADTNELFALYRSTESRAAPKSSIGDQPPTLHAGPSACPSLLETICTAPESPSSTARPSADRCRRCRARSDEARGNSGGTPRQDRTYRARSPASRSALRRPSRD